MVALLNIAFIFVIILVVGKLLGTVVNLLHPLKALVKLVSPISPKLPHEVNNLFELVVARV